MTRKKDTHRSSSMRKLYPVDPEAKSRFKEIKKLQQEYEEELAKQEIEEFKRGTKGV